jgi:hypothetical protein
MVENMARLKPWKCEEKKLHHQVGKGVLNIGKLVAMQFRSFRSLV